MYTTEEHRSVAFLWAKALNAKDIHKAMFPICGGKSLSPKADHNCIDKFSLGLSNVADNALPGAEVTELTVKRLLCCGFRRTGKAMGQVYQYWCMMRREVNVFFCLFEYQCFNILYPFVTYILNLSRNISLHTYLNCHTQDTNKSKPNNRSRQAATSSCLSCKIKLPIALSH
jgi:hypothetical protein